MKRIALVTGGTKGIGGAISKALAADGKVVVASYAGDHEAAKKFHSETGIATYCWSIADFNACSSNISKITEDFGPIDILINNAGIIRDRMMHRMELDDWEKVLHTNLFGCFNMCKAVISGMRDRSWGRIINISSVNALSGCMGQVNYAASKAGIIGLSKALALESAAKQITVNVIAPGYIKTDMTDSIPDKIKQELIKHIPAGRMGATNDVARAAVFLASEDAGYITGETISVNGGQYMQ
jgi:acetoacetyl-CoA reductase